MLPSLKTSSRSDGLIEHSLAHECCRRSADGCAGDKHNDEPAAFDLRGKPCWLSAHVP